MIILTSSSCIGCSNLKSIREMSNNERKLMNDWMKHVGIYHAEIYPSAVKKHFLTFAC